MNLRAYGFTVAAPGLDLPGAAVGAGAPADVEVRVAARDDVAAAFSGPFDPPRLARRRVDGRPVLYERGREEDLLITWEGAGAFRVTRDLVLGWAPQGPVPAWTRFLLDSVLSSVALRRGAEALHAGTVELPGRGAVAVAAGQGGGKSTLVGALMARGGVLVADDVSVLRRHGDGFAVEPAPPVMNVATSPPPGAASPAQLGDVLAELGDELWLRARRVATGPAPLRAMVLLQRRDGAALAVRRLPASPVHLLAQLLDSGADRARQARRFELVADVAERLPVLVLEAPLVCDPGAVCDALLAAPW